MKYVIPTLLIIAGLVLLAYSAGQRDEAKNNPPSTFPTATVSTQVTITRTLNYK